jgi:hypothetical protein
MVDFSPTTNRTLNQPNHCSIGKMKLKVNVVPAKTRYFVTVFTASGATEEAANITLVGHDTQERVWISHTMQLNQRAKDLSMLTQVLHHYTHACWQELVVLYMYLLQIIHDSETRV